MQLTPYLIFNGTCEEALNFYAKALNGRIKDLMRFEGSPAESMTADKQKVLHAHFEADGLFFMASDSGQSGGEEQSSEKVHLSINFDNTEEQEKVFTALSEGGKVTMPLQDTFWGARFGMLTDKFGINWMVNCDKK
ncbi:MAG: VOC family protein [Bacteroidota bacterium]|nr:VOC family protein [Bacteroidota bacterium]